MKMSFIYKSIGLVVLGIFGALIFNVSVLPYMLASTYFENFQFIKDFKEGRIVVNKTDQVYIQQNTAVQDAILRLQSSVVTIGGSSVSSGLIVTSDGEILTLASAVATNTNAKVFFGGQPISFTTVKIDKKNNLALLKIDKNNLQTVSFTDPDSIKLGQELFLVVPTSIKQDQWLANEGIVSQIDSQTVKTNIIEKPIVNGGPLFTLSGELAGLNFVDQDGRISAISINKIRDFLAL